MTLRIGDTVRHGPTGETWIVAAIEQDDLYPAGWPETRARTADCTLVAACDDAGHARMVREVRASSGCRASLAQAHGCSVCEVTP
jgi:hypothetical protein